MLDGMAVWLTRLAQNRPGLLGWPVFYAVLFGVYVGIIAVMLWRAWYDSRSTAAAQRPRFWLTALLLLSVVHGLLYSVVNPPWFAPDEPSHFEYARLVSDLQREPTLQDIDLEIQREMLASMYDFNFWQLNRMAVPDRSPTSFASGLSGDWKDIPPTFVVNDQFLWYFPQVGNEPPPYYWLVSPAFWPFLSDGDMLLQMYAVRWITLLLYVACVVIAFGAARALFPADPDMAPGAAVLLSLLPMLAYMGTAINNDLLGAALGTAWFAAAGLIFMRGWSWKRGGLWIGLTLIAVLTKKTTLFLYPLALIAVVLYVWSRHPLRLNRKWGLALVGAALVVAAVVLGSAFFASGQADLWVGWPDMQGVERTSARAANGTYALRLNATGDRPSRVTQWLSNSAVVDLRGKSVILTAAVASGSDRATGRLLLTDNTGSQSASFVADADWQTIQLTQTVPAAAQYVRVAVVLDSPGTLDVDAITLQLVANAGDVTKEYLHNGSAETAASWVRTVVLALAQPLKLTSYALPWFAQPPEEHLLEILSAGFNTAWGSFWGRFGSLNVAMPVIWEELWKVVSVVALVGVALWLIRRRHSGSPLRFYVVLLIVGVMLSATQVFLPLLNRPNPNWWTQGRFLLPSAMPLMVLLYLGWSAVVPARFRRWLLPAVILFAAFMDGVALYTLITHSYG